MVITKRFKIAVKRVLIELGIYKEENQDDDTTSVPEEELLPPESFELQ